MTEAVTELGNGNMAVHWTAASVSVWHADGSIAANEVRPSQSNSIRQVGIRVRGI